MAESSVKASKTFAAIIAVITLLIGLGIGVVAAPAVFPPPEAVTVTETVPTTVTVATTVTAPAPGLTGEVPIGALLPLSGDLATFGENSKTAAEMAVYEANAFLEKIGAAWRLKLIVEDTATSPDVCLEKLKSLAAKGVKIVVGPQSSAEVRNIKGYADANKILIISQSSTAPGLAIPGDFVYRFCPTDFVQGPAIARLMFDDGISYVIPVWRGDAWGDGLKEATEKRFVELGGVFDEGVRYDPEAKEFSAEVKVLADKVRAAVEAYGADKVGVFYIAFEEVTTFFTQARDYDVLWQVKWYGTDGTALSGALIEDTAAAEFAAAVKFVSTIFAPTKSDKFEKVRSYIKEKLGRDPDSYTYATYDIVWAVTYSLLAVNSYDPEAVKAILPDVTASLFGASGWVVLDEAGDRAFADYDLWAVVEEDGTFKWEHVGAYRYATDSIEWFI